MEIFLLDRCERDKNTVEGEGGTETCLRPGGEDFGVKGNKIKSLGCHHPYDYSSALMMPFKAVTSMRLCLASKRIIHLPIILFSFILSRCFLLLSKSKSCKKSKCG